MREVKKILGIHVTRGPNRSVKIDQHHYIQQVLVEFGMENTRHIEIPMSPSLTLDDQKSKPLEAEDHRQYGYLVGCLMFMAIGTRADLAFSINRLSQYLSEP